MHYSGTNSAFMYRLLRNNKESGPYSAEQLIKMGLKPYDLVWDEGKSAAWLYPSEIPALKEYAPIVEEQPFDRFYKKTSAASVPKEAKSSVKPKFRISAAWRKIEKEEQQPVAQAQTEAPTPSWKEAYSEWQHQTPQQEKRPEITSHKSATPIEITTKFEQPLDEIKEKYVEHFLTSHKKKSGPSLSVSGKQLMEVLLVAGVIALGLWMVFKPEKPENTPATVAATTPAKQIPDEQKKIVTDETAIQQLPETVDEEQSAEPQPATHIQNTPEKSQAKTPIYINAAENKHANTNGNALNAKSASKTTKKLVAQKNTRPVTNAPGGLVQQAVNKNGTSAVSEKNKVYQTANNTTVNPSAVNAIKQQPVIEAPVLPKSNTKTVDELVKVNQFARYPGVVEDVQLSLKNMTSSTLDLVVVDLQYYDKKGFYKKGETLYIKNVPANRDIVVKAPDDLNASNVTYKVSLISSEQKGLYVVAD